MLIFAIGYYLGSARVKHERKIVLKTLSTILQSADELSHNVDSHNIELAAIERTVEDLDVPTVMQKMHQLLLGRINNVISSNKQLKDDLICARYTLDQQARELDQTREEARTDELSQVGNRRAFDEAINYRLSKSKRHGDRFALLVIDVDHFKRINDTHGHEAGDRVVRGVGGTLKECLSPDDFVARCGGDEFAILLESEDRESTIKIAENIRSSADTQDFSTTGHGERVAITFSLGLAFVREGDTVESLFRRADATLYQAKRAGRNCLRVEAEEEDENEHVEMMATS
jgi:diguanylate cyclase